MTTEVEINCCTNADSSCVTILVTSLEHETLTPIQIADAVKDYLVHLDALYSVHDDTGIN